MNGESVLYFYVLHFNFHTLILFEYVVIYCQLRVYNNFCNWSIDGLIDFKRFS